MNLESEDSFPQPKLFQDDKTEGSFSPIQPEPVIIETMAAEPEPESAPIYVSLQPESQGVLMILDRSANEQSGSVSEPQVENESSVSNHADSLRDPTSVHQTAAEQLQEPMPFLLVSKSESQCEYDQSNNDLTAVLIPEKVGEAVTDVGVKDSISLRIAVHTVHRSESDAQSAGDSDRIFELEDQKQIQDPCLKPLWLPATEGDMFSGISLKQCKEEHREKQFQNRCLQKAQKIQVTLNSDESKTTVVPDPATRTRTPTRTGSAVVKEKRTEVNHKMPQQKLPEQNTEKNKEAP